MKGENKSEAAILRQKVVELLNQNNMESGSLLNETEIHKLFHKLEIYLIELEIQNEELMSSFNDRKKAEESLIASEARYRRLFESAKDGILILDAETGMITDVNPFLIEMLGYSKDQFLNKAIWETGFFKDIIADKDKYLDLLQKEYVRYDDLPHSTDDGRKINVEFVINVYKVEKEMVIQCHIKDISKYRKVEDALFESEIKYRAFFENSMDAILLTTPDGKTLAANPAACNMFGYSEEELIKLGKLGIVEASDPRLSVLLAERKLKGKAKGEITLKREDGTLFPAEISSAIFKNPEGFERTSMIIRDNTARKNTEKEIMNLAKFPSENPNPILRISHNGTLLYVNEAGMKQLPDWNLQTGKSVTNLLHDAVFNAFNIGEVQVTEFEHFEKIYSFYVVPFVEEGYANLYGWDITERKQAEERLRESENEFHTLAESMPQIVWITRADGWNIYFNQNWVDYTGLTLEESLGHGWNKPFHPDDQKIAWDAWQNATKNNAVYSIESRLRRADGIYNWFLVRGVPLMDNKGTILKWFGTCTDINELKLAEDELRESEERFRITAENLMDVIYDWDIKENIQWYGDIDGITGYPPGGFPRTLEAWAVIIHPEDKDRVMAALEDHLKRAATYAVEYRIRRRDGEWRWWSARGTALRNDWGEPYKMMGSITDITEQKDIQNRIKFDSELLSRIGQAVIATDLQGNVIYWNNGAEEIYGWSSVEAMGQNIVVLTPTEQTKEQAIEIMKVLSEGNSWSGEFLVKRKDGSIFPADVTDAPFIDSDGKLIGIIGISSDITERKRTKETLLKLSSAVEQTIDTIVITDREGRIEYVNPAFEVLTGYTSEEAVGNTPRILKSGIEDQEYYERMWNTILSGKVFRAEVVNKKKNGDLFDEEKTISPIFDKNKIITHFVGTGVNISKRKIAERELIEAKEHAEESDRLKSAFLANMSHEVRTPLNSIIGFSELLADSYFDEEQKNEFIQSIIISGNNLLSIISDIMDISKMESGEIAIRRSQINVQKFILIVKEQFAIQVEGKKLELNLTHPDHYEETAVFADAERLKQIFNNLMSNAIKFTMNGSIEIGYQPKGKMIEFYVKDTGIGIPAEFHNALFERFMQVEAGNSRKYGGNGLGLAISKKLVELMGGKIWVVSEPGTGSVFYFTLPIYN